MIGARQLLHPRLRHAAAQRAAAQFRPLSHRQFLPRVSRNFQSTARPTSTIWRFLDKWSSAPRLATIMALTFGGGYVGGKMVEINTRAPLGQGTVEDEQEKQRLYDRFVSMDAVKWLRSHPDYVEMPAYGNYEPQDKARRLTSGPLSGSKGLPVQRVFWNGKEMKAVNIVYFGAGMEGFPTMVHGGAMATIVDETLARVAIHHFPERTGVTANLDINYVAPASSENFYLVYASLDYGRSTDRKAYVKGEVRDADGKVCVTASGLFLVPKGYQLQRLGDDY
ncbi:PaaI family thioesterase [Aspergillus stella-maris]|uniref:PaaI family thioesterase n=1 Tax=Aspergillus stella-maris TaxID=1810926 RepID=UPI003CCDB02E